MLYHICLLLTHEGKEDILETEVECFLPVLPSKDLKLTMEWRGLWFSMELMDAVQYSLSKRRYWATMKLEVDCKYISPLSFEQFALYLSQTYRQDAEGVEQHP